MTVLATAAPPLQRDLDLETLRAAFGHHPSGVAALIAQVDGVPAVLIASSFTVGVSADPPLVSVAVQRTSTSWPLLRRARRDRRPLVLHDSGFHALAPRAALATT